MPENKVHRDILPRELEAELSKIEDLALKPSCFDEGCKYFPRMCLKQEHEDPIDPHVLIVGSRLYPEPVSVSDQESRGKIPDFLKRGVRKYAWIHERSDRVEKAVKALEIAGYEPERAYDGLSNEVIEQASSLERGLINFKAPSPEAYYAKLDEFFLRSNGNHNAQIAQ